MRTAKLRDHAIGRIRMSVLQSSDIVTYRDERVKVVKGATVKKELELLSRVIAIARAEWGIQMAANPASGRLVKRPAPQDGDVRDRRLAEVHVAVKGNPPPAPDPVKGGAPPTKPGPASRRVRPDEAYEDDPEITALLAMPHSEQQALLRACRYPTWFTQRKREVTAATLKARLKRKAKAPLKAQLLGGCRWCGAPGPQPAVCRWRSGGPAESSPTEDASTSMPSRPRPIRRRSFCSSAGAGSRDRWKSLTQRRSLARASTRQPGA